MLKLIVTLVVVAVALMMWFGKGRGKAPARGASPQRGRPDEAAAAGEPQAMVACARCGMHVPRAELFLNDRGQPFCGAEHRRLGAQAPHR